MNDRSAWLLLEGPVAARAAGDRNTLTTDRSMWLLLEGPGAAAAAHAPRGTSPTGSTGPQRAAATSRS